MNNSFNITELGDVYDARVISLLYSEGALSAIECLSTPFDCFVVNRQANLSARQIETLALELVRLPVEWVEVFDESSEEIHDAVDLCSAQIGRQSAVGDGDPMTAWNNDARSDLDIADWVVGGGHGSAGLKVIIVVGDAEAEKRLVNTFVELHKRE